MIHHTVITLLYGNSHQLSTVSICVISSNVLLQNLLSSLLFNSYKYPDTWRSHQKNYTLWITPGLETTLPTCFCTYFTYQYLLVYITYIISLAYLWLQGREDLASGPSQSLVSRWVLVRELLGTWRT